MPNRIYAKRKNPDWLNSLARLAGRVYRFIFGARG